MPDDAAAGDDDEVVIAAAIPVARTLVVASAIDEATRDFVVGVKCCTVLHCEVSSDCCLRAADTVPVPCRDVPVLGRDVPVPFGVPLGDGAPL